VIGLPTDNLLAPGTLAEFTVFELSEADLDLTDSTGHQVRLKQLIEPRWTIVGVQAVRAGRYVPDRASAPSTGCPHCGWISGR
jgi:dihydroorotase